MNRNNTSSWFPMKLYDKTAQDGVLFGPAKQPEKTSYLYPNEKIKKDETVIWVPAEHKTVSLKSYERAHLENDIEKLGLISKIGIALGCTFGSLIRVKP